MKIYQENLGWPRNTLMRFRMFLNIERQLQEFDYIFFLNANMLPVAPVGDEILPTEEQGLMVMIHPGAYQKDRAGFPYETNPASTAFIPAEQGEYYFMGSFNGGRTKAVLQSYHDMFNNIQKDLEKGIIAVWHDESHLNSYILNKKPLILLPEYGYPEGWTPPRPIKAKILILDKSKPKYGGHDYLRGISNKKRGYLHHYLGRCKHYLAKIAQIILQKQSLRRR